MKFVDIPGQDRPLEDEITAAITDIVRRGDFILGREVGELEDMLKEYLQVQNAVLVSSGTDAMALALRALNLPKGSSVITTPFTFFATSEVLINEGLVPKYVDIDPRTYNISPDSINAAIDGKTSAIMPVHIFGGPCDMEGIMQIANEHGLPVIEDCAQAFGASVEGKMVGSFGEFGCFSFYPTKNLGAYGDAGLLVTDDSEMAEKIRILRNQGSATPYRHDYAGFNSRCDTIQAAVLKAKLPHVDKLNERRRTIAALYKNGLTGMPGLTLPIEAENTTHVYHQFTIQLELRDALKRALEEVGIPTAIYYDMGLHRQEALATFPSVDLPQTEAVCSRVLSLPIHPVLTNEEINRVINSVRQFING